MGLKDRIKELEQELQEAKDNSSVYVHEVHTLHCSNGELYMDYGSLNNECKSVVFNISSLFNDLPCIVDIVCQEHKKQTQDVIDRIKQL